MQISELKLLRINLNKLISTFIRLTTSLKIWNNIILPFQLTKICQFTLCRCKKRAYARKKSGSLSRRTASVVSGFPTGNQELQLTSSSKLPSSSSSSASGRSEDAPNQGSLLGSDHQVQSQQDDSGPEESPVYILTSAKGDRSYKLRDSR